MSAGVRYRCTGCGNLTRFDVIASRRTKALYHFSVGGDLTVEEESVLDGRVEQVTCVWCGATGDRIAEVPSDVVAGEAPESS
ncbi:MAG: hypothetical protein ACHQIG_08615 [Acidimicrobiia bacterium]